MLRVTIELVPFGVGTPRVLGHAVIANDGTGTHDVGNYDAEFYDTDGLCGVARLDGFDRLHRDAWALLTELLERIETP